MIPGAATRHRPVLLHRTEPVSTPDQRDQRDRGHYLTPRLYPETPVDPWASDAEPVMAKASM